MLSAATAVVGAAGAPGVGADGDGQPEAKPPKLSFDDARLKAQLDGARRRRRNEEKRRNSPAARKARRRSVTAFAGHGRADALRLARTRFPEYVRQPAFKPLRLMSGERVLEYKSAFSALVKIGDGDSGSNTALAESTFPLRSKLGTGEAAPVSLVLNEHRDRYEPRNPSVALRIAKDPTAGVRVGDVRVRAAQSSDPVSLSGNTAFFANANGSDRDLDLMVTPDPLGAEFAWQIRSARSPKTLALRFKLPAGASLEVDESLPAQRAKITRDGKDIATVSPASAYDADGYPVATSYAVHGSTLALKVDHRGEDIAYPILVDPAIEHYLTDANGQPLDDCTGGFLAPPPRWTPSAAAGQGWQGAETCEGLWLWKLWPGGYGEVANWHLYPPSPNAFFTRVQFYASHDNNQGFNCIIEGAWDGWYESGQWFHPAPFKPSTPPYVTHEPWFGTDGTDEGDPANYRGDSCTNHHFNFKDHFFTTPNPNNIVVFGYWSGGGSDAPEGTPYVLLRGTTNFLDDNDYPQLSASHTGLPSGWAERVIPSVNASATESGLGVHHIDLTLQHTSGSKTQTHSRGCEGGTKYPCQPPAWAKTIEYDTDDVDPDTPDNQPVPEGMSTARLRAYDATGKASNEVNWPLKVDRSPPSALNPSGALYQPDGKWFKEGAHHLTLQPTDAYSGVRSSELQMKPGPSGIDGFTRSASGGWGTADLGGAWSIAGDPTKFSVDGARGRIDAPQDSPQYGLLDASAVRDADVKAEISYPTPSGPGAHIGWIVLRRQSDGRQYRVGLARDGVTQRLSLRGDPAGALFAEVDTGITYVPGARYNLRARIVGDGSPDHETRVRARVWKVGTPEPSSWTVDAFDQESIGPQAEGVIGLAAESSLPGIATFGFDDLVAVDLDRFRTLATRDDGCDDAGCSTSATHQFDWQTSGYPEGAYEFRGIAKDPLAYTGGTPDLHTLTGSPWRADLDRTPPEITDKRGSMASANGAIRRGANDLAVAASDSPSGVRSMEAFVSDADQPGSPRTSLGRKDCTDPEDSCPAFTGEWQWDSSHYAPDHVQVTVEVTDKAGNTAPAETWTVYVDDDKPSAPVISGALSDARDKAVSGTSFDLHVEAEDGTVANPSSGVKQIKLFAGREIGSLTERLASDAQDCAENNCEQTWDTTFTPLASDESRTPRRFRVRVEDQVGNASDDPPSFPSRVSRWRLGETSGTQARDSKGSNDGTYTGGYTLDEPGAGTDGDKAVKLDGSSGYVDVGNPSTLQLSTGTIEAWVKAPNPGSGYRGIVAKEWAYGLFLKDGVVMAFDWSTFADRSTGVSVADGNWHHVAMSFRSGVAGGTVIYIDGVPRHTTTITMSNQNTGLQIGASGGGAQLAATVDDVAVYSSALSAGEVAQLYSQDAYDWKVVFDNGAPRLDEPTHEPSPSSWFNGSASLEATLTGHDPISGVKRFKLFTPKQDGGEDEQTHDDPSCSDAITNLCPTDPPAKALSYSTENIPEGADNTVRALVEDAVGNASDQRTWKLKVDRTPPELELSGPLKEREGQELPDGTYELVAHATDGVTGGSDAQRRSGVKSIEVFVDGAPAGYVTQPCATDSCPLTLRTTFKTTDYPGGSHLVEVRATDQLGHESSESFTVKTRCCSVPPAVWGSAGTGLHDIAFGDVDGDGLDDAVRHDRLTSEVRVALSRGSDFEAFDRPWGSWQSLVSFALADFTGDGLADLVGRHAQSNALLVAPSTGSGFGPPQSLGAWNGTRDVHFADLDGDGAADVAGRDRVTNAVWTAYSTGDGLEPAEVQASWDATFDLVLADINADGSADLVGRNPTGDVRVALASAYAFEPAAVWANAGVDHEILVADVNGDENADLVRRNVQSGALTFAASDGTRFGSFEPYGSSFGEQYDLSDADADGDGNADLVGVLGLTGELRVAVTDMTTPVVENADEFVPDEALDYDEPDAFDPVDGQAQVAAAPSGCARQQMRLGVQDEPFLNSGPSTGQNAVYDRVSELGACVIRMNLYQGVVDSGNGDYLFNQPNNRFDLAVDRARQAGYQVYLTLTGAATRALDCAPELNPRGVGCIRPTGLNPSPAQIDAFANFARAAVDHFKPRGVRTYAIWNEPNVPIFLQDAPGVTPARLYGEIYRKTYQRLVGTGANVLIGELANRMTGGRIERDGSDPRCKRNKACFTPLRFLEEAVREASGTDDETRASGVAWHPYQHEAPPGVYRGGKLIPSAGNRSKFGIGALAGIKSGISRLRKGTTNSGGKELRTTSGRVVPLYLTEFGYLNRPRGFEGAGVGNYNPKKNKQWHTEAVRAEWWKRALDLALQSSRGGGKRAGPRIMLMYQLVEIYPRNEQAPADPKAACPDIGDQRTRREPVAQRCVVHTDDYGLISSGAPTEPGGSTLEPFGIGWGDRYYGRDTRRPRPDLRRVFVRQPRDAFCKIRGWVFDHHYLPPPTAAHPCGG